MTNEKTAPAPAPQEATLRYVVLGTYYVCLTVAWISLLYLLFMFGHTETAPLPRVLTTAGVASVCVIIAGILRWAGLPKAPEKKDK